MGGPSLAELRAAHPGEWAVVERELTALVAAQDRAALARYVQEVAAPLPAGSDPGERIQPEVSHAMKEVGISLGEEFPKPLTDEVVAAADVVITMGCGDTCPYIPGRRYEDWPIADPAETDADGEIGRAHV